VASLSVIEAAVGRSDKLGGRRGKTRADKSFVSVWPEESTPGPHPRDFPLSVYWGTHPLNQILKIFGILAVGRDVPAARSGFRPVDFPINDVFRETGDQLPLSSPLRARWLDL
jgi:hypothetical protein